MTVDPTVLPDVAAAGVQEDLGTARPARSRGRMVLDRFLHKKLAVTGVFTLVVMFLLAFVVLLAGFGWMITSRVVRGMTLSRKEREYVDAARVMGVPAYKIIFRHILPNMSSLLIIDATVNVGIAVIGEAGLAFFGFGI